MPEPVTSTPFLQAFAKLPDLMKSIYMHEETTDFNVEIGDKHQLTDEQGMKMARLMQMIVMKSLPPKDLPPRIESDLLLDTKRAKAVSLDLLGLRCLPMEWYIGPVEPIIRNLGGRAEAYLERVRPIYPEVFSGGALKLEPDMDPEDEKMFNPVSVTPNAAPSGAHANILENFDHRLESFAGRAEILLRLTGLGTEIEEAAKNGKIPAAEAEQHIAALDNISSAINSRDLNPFEINALHRRLIRLVDSLEGKV